MKKVLLATALMALSTLSFATEVTKVSFAQVSIEDNTMHLTLPQGKKTIALDDSYMFTTIEKTFINTSQDNVLLLVQASSGGNGCPAMYFVVDIHKNGIVKQSPEFGTCSDIPKISYSNNSIILQMPELNGKKIATFTYTNGVVSKNGKVVK